MAVSTSVTVSFAYAVTEVAPDRFKVGSMVPIFDPVQTWDDFLALPEYEGATCPKCSRVVVVCDGVWFCEPCFYRWRWPGVVGMD